MSRRARLAERVLERLHQEVGDAPLAVGDADVKTHGGHPVAGEGLAHQDLADDRAVAVGDDDLVAAHQDGEQALAGPRRELDLLFRGAPNVAGVNRVPADRDEKTGGLPPDGHRLPSSSCGAAMRIAASTASALDSATRTPARSRVRRCAA